MVIEVKNVCKVFKNTSVLNDVNMTFKSGHIYGINGRNGSGKSVLLKILCGIYYPSSGSILYDGKEYSSDVIISSNIRALIENPSFFPGLSGFENLKILAKIQNKISDKEIDKALEEVNLLKDKNKLYSEYSLGMKQKLGIAQVIMEDPHVLVLDEPFNGIEEESVKKLMKFLIDEKNNGKIIILSSHIKDDLDNIADVIYKFDAGNVTVINNRES